MSWAYPTSDGGIAFELYDFGEAAEAAFGNDVAFVATVAPAAVPALLQALDAASVEGALAAVVERFESYFAATSWLEAARIPHTRTFEPHA